MNVLICGGRDYNNSNYLFQVLNSIHGKDKHIKCIIHGAALGVDSLAQDWADEHGVHTLAFPADWLRYKKAAGPIRNKQMLDEGMPDLVVAFAGGKGTDNMVKIAKEAGVVILDFRAKEAGVVILDCRGT